MLRLLDCVAFNALLGNHDAHAKNFSLRYRHPSYQSSPTLAPLYDVLSTAVYPNLPPKMAMKLGSKYMFGDVQARHWEQFAEAAGLARADPQAHSRRGTGAAVGRPRHAGPPAFAGAPLVDRIVTLVEQRATLTVQRLTGGNDSV